MTKYVGKEDLDRHMEMAGMEVKEGRSRLAPELSGSTWIIWSRKEKTWEAMAQKDVQEMDAMARTVGMAMMEITIARDQLTGAEKEAATLREMMEWQDK